MIQTTNNTLNMDTIAAIATSTEMGGIGIVRISGEKAFEIGQMFFSGKREFSMLPPNYLAYGKFVDQNEVIDEVMIVKMKNPHSFTREDIVEIHCHGGKVVLSNILSAIIKTGKARLAEAGEFTKRAFLNGRIDLSQAEAVIDLINAKTEKSSKVAIMQLNGALSEKIHKTKARLIEIIAHLEACADYPEYDIEEITNETITQSLEFSKANLLELQNGYSTGRILRDGINIAITGKPNVGKSSLLNKLAGKTKAIVTNIPGTTRDVVDDYINIAGVPVRIIDTAGIRETEDEVEKIGVQAAKQEVENADIVIFMIDAASGYLEEDARIFEKIECKNKIVLINKIDMLKELPQIELPVDEVIFASVKEGVGVSDLQKVITKLFGDVSAKGEEAVISNVRHKALVDKCIEVIDQAEQTLQSGMPIDCVSIYIQDAAQCLGEITGENVNEDIVNEIFGRFCIGK